MIESVNEDTRDDNVENLSKTESILKKEEEELNQDNLSQSFSDLSLDMESFIPDSGYDNDDEEDASNDVYAKLSSSWQFQYVTHL